MFGLGAILRMFGTRYGYYDLKDWNQAGLIDPIVDTFADQMGAMSAFAFASEDADKAPLIEAYVSMARKFHSLVEANLNHHGGKFAAGNKVTIADFVMASHIGNYVTNAAFPL